MMDLSRIRVNDKNPRLIKDAKFKKLCNSVKEFPKMLELRPIVIDKDGVILGGNMRFRALRENKMELREEWFREADQLTEEERRRFIVEDNIGFGEWEWEQLANDYDKQELEDWGLDVEKWEDDEVIEDDVPEVSNEEPVSKLGEVYQLGRHRLMCGDSTKIEDVEKLMDGKKADMVFTDPPYGIDIVNSSNADITAQVGFGKVGTKGLVPARNYSKVIGDDKPFDPTFLLELADRVILWGANNFSSKLRDNAQWLVWDKKCERGADHNNFSDCELAWTNINAKSVRIYRYLWSGLLREGERGVELSERVHPTQKPVGLLAEIIKDFSKDNEIILDLFLGSGSTLIACEQTNRICYGMELDPKYCDVIRKRYAKFVNNEENWQDITKAI